MGTSNKVLVISKEKQIFEQIQQVFFDENNVAKCEWRENLLAGLAAIRQFKPDIIFLDEELCYPDVSSAVKELTIKVPEARIILLARMGRRDKIDAAILAGAAGYLLKPVDSSEVVTTVRRVLANFTPEPVAQPHMSQVGKIISLFSTVDGVGKSTIAVNLAILLAKISGEKVCLVDADFQFGDVCRFLYIEPTVTIADFVANGVNSGHSANDYLLKGLGMVDILAAPREPGQSQLVTPAIMNAAIKELACTYNYIVIDTAMGFTEVGLDILEMSNLILFVNTLDSISCVKNLRLGMDTLRDLGYTKDKVHLILNRHKAKTAIGVAEVEKAINSPFIVKLANDFSTASGAIQAQLPMVLYQPDRDISRDLLEMAKRIIEDNLVESQKSSSIADRLSRWLKG